MKASLRACWSLFRIRMAESLQYRMAALASASISIFWALIEITVYSVFYLHGAHGGAPTLTLPQTVSYVWLGQAIWALAPMSVDSELLGKIVNGDVGVELCRPLDLYAHWFTKTAAGRLGGFWWRALITLVVGACMPAGFQLGAPASVTGLVLFLVSLTSAFLLGAAYGMLVTTIRLGITWGEGPTYMLLLLGGVLSGGYLPLPLWPDVLQPFLLLQPFAGYLDLPIRLYIGVISPTAGLLTIALQLGWIVAFILAGRALLRRKLRTIIVQGG